MHALTHLADRRFSAIHPLGHRPLLERGIELETLANMARRKGSEFDLWLTNRGRQPLQQGGREEVTAAEREREGPVRTGFELTVSLYDWQG